MQKEIQKSLSCRNTHHSSSRNVLMRDIVVGRKNAALYPAFARAASTGMTNAAKGFTLIELLVVVLIIGILSAVALPQYQKAVEKSRATQAITLLKSVYQAAENYYLANGEWPTSFDELSVDIPWTGTRQLYGVDGRSNNEWSLELDNREEYKGVFVARLSGKYKGGKFAIWKQHESNAMPLDTLLCSEQKNGTYSISQVGIYCPKLFQSTRKISEGSTGATYTFMQ